MTFRVWLAVGALGLVAGCAPPPEADPPASARVLAAPAPELAPTAAFNVPVAGGEAAAGRLEAGTAELAARAAALRSRGQTLSGETVVDPDARERLERERDATGL